MTEVEKLMIAQKVSEVTDLIKTQCLAARSGVNINIVKRITTIGRDNYVSPSDRHVKVLNQAISEIADDIDSYMTLHYGDDVPAKLKEWRKIINLPYIFCDLLGKHVMWYKKRMRHGPTTAQGRKYYYYNTFTEQDVQDINNAIKVVSTKLRAMHLP